ncbi:undecaprenyldiphospho-muramoylpentapeptide beta-N-acetylglucosaminyltransferase [Pseudarthrobacter sp. J1738]|uniref:undecaprenyldiphospho-muramoylpentapeptide beta-N-acetylglucosaminyltransferase n=1 Tax=unclassified Pseudarthrobacter TaxID=2647000 RepID=UPI003D2738F7
MSSPSLSVVLAGGGTAGHISPMLAIADALRARVPDATFLTVGTAEGMETRIVPQAGYELATIARVPLPRKPSPDLLKLPFRMVAAVRSAGRILDESHADVLVGVGGYVCTPMYLAAKFRKIPTVIHEANVRPGLANRVGVALGASVATAFARTRLGKSVHVGMPMRKGISRLDRETARAAALEKLGLNPARPVLVVTGGSSGALSINTALKAALPDLAAAGIQTVHITGRGKQVMDGDVALAAAGYTQLEYVDAMETVYAAADLLLARAGAGTVCEVAAVGLPAVFVPLPIGNGEQARNAEELVEAGGALLIADKDLSADFIASTIVKLLLDPVALKTMHQASVRHGIRDADQRMADLVLKAAAK